MSFKNSIIIMTSNLGSQFIQEFMETGDKDAMDNAIQAALRQSFSPEFLNRIDEIITFTSLDMEHLEKIVDLQLEKVRERLAERRIALELTPAVLERLVARRIRPAFRGASAQEAHPARDRRSRGQRDGRWQPARG